jgi:hypothetical protein
MRKHVSIVLLIGAAIILTVGLYVRLAGPLGTPTGVSPALCRDAQARRRSAQEALARASADPAAGLHGQMETRVQLEAAEANLQRHCR